MSPPLHEFKMEGGNFPTTTPSEKYPITNPLELLLCRYPLGANLSNPNFVLIHSRPFEFDEYTDPLWSLLSAGSNAHVSRPKAPGAQTFWMKTYSENEGLLEKLEKLNILKRTGETHKQGFVELVAVETCLVSGQWAETCSNQECGRREQLEDKKPRMRRCARCKEAYYCNAECQKAGWGTHKERCGTFKETAADRAAASETN